MDEKELELKAIESLAVNDPVAFINSKPSPREWTLSPQEIAKTVSINPYTALTTKEQREGKRKLSMIETIGAGVFEGTIGGIRDLNESLTAQQAMFTSPNMTEEEANRLMEDVLYTRHFSRQARAESTAERIKYGKTYDFSNGIGSVIQLVGVGLLTGSPAAVGIVAGAESAAALEADLVDRYIEKTGKIEGYDKEERTKDITLASAYGVFTGITESLLGVERLATGAINRTAKADALARLMRTKGEFAKSTAIKTAGKLAQSAIGEGSEEFIQSLGEDATVAIAGYADQLTADGVFKKALTSAIYGAIIGGPLGTGLYRYNRKTLVDKINKISEERELGLSEAQVQNVADDMLDNGRQQMLDEIATRAEIKNKYGQAYETVKARIKEQIEATGTQPWTRQDKTADEYIEAVASSITLPAIVQANKSGLPLSEFLEVAEMQVINNVLYFSPINDIASLEVRLEEQNNIIREENAKKTLNNQNEARKQDAQRRKAIIQNAITAIKEQQGIQNRRITRRKEQNDYITAKDLAPDQMTTLETAQEAKAGEDYVLFGGKRIPVSYEVVELNQIQPSHINGVINEKYTNKELQNRASRGTTQDVADLREKASNITPERLLKSPTSAEGAPVINAQGEVIAGNGRSEIIRFAYENETTAQRYKKALAEAGFNIEGMQQPILVRRNTTMTEQEQVAAADISNISETSAFDEASQAKRDTQYLKDSAGPIDFAGKLPMSERRGLMLNNGKWNKRKVQQRYEDALLSWICGNDTQLFESLVLDRNLSQKVIDVLTNNGELIYNLQEKFPETEIRQDLYHALVKMQITNKDNFIESTQAIELDGRDVMPENVFVWSFLYADSTTNKLFLNNYINTLQENREAVNSGKDMFGQSVAPLSKKDAFIQALKTTDEARAQMAADRGRQYEGLFSENGEIKNAELATAIVSYQNQFAPQVINEEQNNLFQEQLDLANENARLDDIYPEYTGETIEINGIERTVYNSNGDRIAKSAEALRNFYKWFGDSKVVDEQGRPLVVYHGSDKKFSEFKYPDYRNTLMNWKGTNSKFFFTQKKELAETYSSERDIVYKVYLKAQNPRILDLNGTNWAKIDIENAKTTDQLAEDTYKKGYDSLIIKNIDESITGSEKEIVDDYIVFEPNQIKSTENRGTFASESNNIYFQARKAPNGWYDPELQAIVLGKTWNETTIVHEFHHRYLEKIFGIYKEAQQGTKTVKQEWIQETEKLFDMLGVDTKQETLTTVQQEQFATMVEAYITGLGIEKPETQAFTDFLNWVPEKYKSIMNIGYLDKDGNITNPILDEQSIDFFNRWFGNPTLPSLPSAPSAQKMVNPTDKNGEIVPSSQKEMNNREKEWGQESTKQSNADNQLWRAIDENIETNMRASMDSEKEQMQVESEAIEDDRSIPQKKRDRWFKTYQPEARERAANMAREYLKKNPEKARELAFLDPETSTEFEAPVDRGMLIRAVMETVEKGSDEWYILDDNLATVKSMSASTLSLSGDISHRAYLDAKREVEDARELKAAMNYAGSSRGALDKWNKDIKEFIAKRVGAIIATEANSDARKTAIKAFIEEAKTKFSANTTNAILNQLDLTGVSTKDRQVFVKWAEKQIKQAAHAKLDSKEMAELMKASVKAQIAMKEIDSTKTDTNGNFARATESAKALREWQEVKDKMKKAYIGKWGRFGIMFDNLFGSYAPAAMLMSVNTLFVANIPSTAINNSIVKSSAKKIFGQNLVDAKTIKAEENRIRQIFGASGINLAQMEKPTSPSVLHGEKYMQQEQHKWYEFVFKTLGWGDNLFRVPTFVDALARIASKNANGNKATAEALFREYSQLNNQSDEAKIARKQALAVANMGTFTQEGIMASCLNHIRSELNRLSRGLVGLDPNGFGLGNLLAPFLKTGANVVEMGVRGSIAPVVQLTTSARIASKRAGTKARMKNMGATDEEIKKALKEINISDIEKIALRTDWKYFAFTAVSVALLAALSGEDEWYEEPYQVGYTYDPYKPYDSIRIGKAWIKIDMFGPFAIPIRTAAKIIKNWEDDKLYAIAKGYGFGASEALSDLPLANQITDNNMDYMFRQPGKWAQGFAYNQINKLVPAQFKSITKATSRSLDLEAEPEEYFGDFIGRKINRNYGFDGEQLTTNDIINLFTNRLKWGNE